MTLYLQACGAVLLTVILVLTLKHNNKELGAVLTISVCCMVALATMHYLEPVVDFLQTLENLGGLDNAMTTTLLKATGIGMVTEIAGLVCKDAGNESLGKVMQLLGTSVILWLSMPLLTALIELLQKILGDL